MKVILFFRNVASSAFFRVGGKGRLDKHLFKRVGGTGRHALEVPFSELPALLADLQLKPTSCPYPIEFEFVEEPGDRDPNPLNTSLEEQIASLNAELAAANAEIMATAARIPVEGAEPAAPVQAAGLSDEDLQRLQNYDAMIDIIAPAALDGETPVTCLQRLFKTVAFIVPLTEGQEEQQEPSSPVLESTEPPPDTILVEAPPRSPLTENELLESKLAKIVEKKDLIEAGVGLGVPKTSFTRNASMKMILKIIMAHVTTKGAPSVHQVPKTDAVEEHIDQAQVTNPPMVVQVAAEG